MTEKKLKRRQRLILRALSDLGGEATTRQIADKAQLSVNGVSQSLGVLREYVSPVGGKAGETKWVLTEKS
jgi:hypothetical protein